MHELAATERLVELVVQECERNGLREPKRIIIEVGDFTSYTAESLSFYFNLAKKNEPVLKAAELEVRNVAAIAICQKCGEEMSLKGVSSKSCRKCGSGDMVIRAGRDLVLKMIEG